MGKERQRHSHDQDDRFSRLMFGDKREVIRNNHHEASNSKSSSFDVESIIENIVKLKDSSENLKPLIQMVYPLVEQFWKKK